jgi:tetratricopeptide (TPR) repeat protein
LFALGNIYEYQNNYNKAISIYKQAIDFEIVYPQVKTQAYINYSELVIKTKRVELYDEVEVIIFKRISDSLFPIEKYKGYSILSIISKYKKNKAQAKQFAALADENANAKTSGLRYHKYLGVVKFRESWLDKILKKM